jgi:hypothetical protein
MPLIGDDPEVDIPLWIPGGESDLTPLRAAFVMQANSTLLQIQRALTRMRSSVLYTDKFQPGANWFVLEQKIRVVGETWAYLELTLQRRVKKYAVPSSGNFKPIILGAIGDTALVPQSLAGLSSTKQGRLCVAHVLNSGEVRLDAINSGADILVNDIITLAGAYPLDDYIDSEV